MRPFASLLNSVLKRCLLTS